MLLNSQINMPRTPQITVIGNAEATPEQYQISVEVGQTIAELGFIAITGGRGGVMEAVAKGVQDKGGICVGILPSGSHRDGNAYNTITIPTGIGHARNSMTVLAADIVIAIGGGAGTLSELAFAWVYDKPVIAYQGIEGWANELAERRLDGRRGDKILAFSDVAELEDLLKGLVGSSL